MTVWKPLYPYDKNCVLRKLNKVNSELSKIVSDFRQFLVEKFILKINAAILSLTSGKVGRGGRCTYILLCLVITQSVGILRWRGSWRFWNTRGLRV